MNFLIDFGIFVGLVFVAGYIVSILYEKRRVKKVQDEMNQYMGE